MTTITTKYPFTGCLDTRQGGRNENQDNAGFVDTPLGLLVVVCDGMGGGPGGRTASLMAVDTILSVLSDVAEHTKREDALRYAIGKANDAIYSKAKETPELRGMGTTVAAVLLNETSAMIAHVGDSRIYLLRKGTIVWRSADHSLVANLVRQGKLTEEEARNHPRSNVIIRALGIRPAVEAEVNEVSFHTGDRFVICSDGIWGMMPQRDLIASLSRAMGISELTTRMTKEIDDIGNRDGGGHDNMTLAIIDTPFDSVFKKVREKSTDEDNMTKEHGKCDKGFFQKKGNKIILLLGCVSVLAIALIAVINNQSATKESLVLNDTEVNDTVKRGSTETTVPQLTEITNEDEKADEAATDTIKEQRQPQDSSSPVFTPNKQIEQRDNLISQIKNIIKDLDSLKNIERKDRKKSEEAKQQFINKKIKPDVENLGNRLNKHEKERVSKIVRLLIDKNTIQSDDKGRTTKQSAEHIEKIKKVLKALQKR